jgi:hypothetical protein
MLYDMASLMRERLPTDAQLGEMIYGKAGRAAPFSVRPGAGEQGRVAQRQAVDGARRPDAQDRSVDL